MKFKIGPGLLVAAAGIGAGDMILGIQLGIDFNIVFIFMVIFICVIKYILTEGIARRQLVVQESMVRSWVKIFPKPISYVLLLFFIVWSFMVAGALISAIGLASHSIFPRFSQNIWSIIFSIVAFAIIFFGRYQTIENLTKILIGLMFFIVIGTAAFQLPEIIGNFGMTRPSLQFDTSTLLFSIIGGVGGSVTMLSYGYWIIEKKWNGVEYLEVARNDLKLSYFLTGFFVLSLMAISSSIEYTESDMSGVRLISYVAEILEGIVGTYGGHLFRICFWGVIFSSVITVWSGIPYIFSDFLNLLLNRNTPSNTYAKSREYRLFLGFISFLPIVLVFYMDAVKNVINYTLISSLFVVIMAASLYILNGKKHINVNFSNSSINKLLLVLSIVLFMALLLWKVF